MTDELAILTAWLFKGWQSIGRILVVGTLAYVGLLVILRISGKRTLSKMNAFDLVVTVALGSTLSTIIVSRQTGVADGLTALVLLIGLQYMVAWLSVRWPGFNRLNTQIFAEIQQRTSLLKKELYGFILIDLTQ